MRNQSNSFFKGFPESFDLTDALVRLAINSSTGSIISLQIDSDVHLMFFLRLYN